MIVITNIEAENDTKDIKSYNLKINDKINEIIMELYINEGITFKVKQANIISYIIYNKKYKYDKIITIIILPKDYYDETTKILKHLYM